MFLSKIKCKIIVKHFFGGYNFLVTVIDCAWGQWESFYHFRDFSQPPWQLFSSDLTKSLQEEAQ